VFVDDASGELGSEAGELLRQRCSKRFAVASALARSWGGLSAIRVSRLRSTSLVSFSIPFRRDRSVATTSFNALRIGAVSELGIVVVDFGQERDGVGRRLEQPLSHASLAAPVRPCPKKRHRRAPAHCDQASTIAQSECRRSAILPI
jgi:hypothetical protein